MSTISMNLSRKDIRYRGFLTYRGLRLFALIAMSISQFSGVTLLACKLAALLGQHPLTDQWLEILTIAKNSGQITFPLLLISSFAVVLNHQESFKKMLIQYFALAAVTYIGIIFLLNNFLSAAANLFPTIAGEILQAVGLEKTPELVVEAMLKSVLPGDGTICLDALNPILQNLNVSVTLPSFDDVKLTLNVLLGDEELTNSVLSLVTSLDAHTLTTMLFDFLEKGLSAVGLSIQTLWEEIGLPIVNTFIHSRLNVNVFWDLFLYTLFYFFISYVPKTLHGGKLLVFRSCAVFPAGWLIISAMVISAMRSSLSYELPTWFIALLGGRNLSALCVFFLLVLFEMYRKAEHDSNQGTEEEWQAFYNSNRSSLQFSVFACFTLIAVSLLDYLLSFVPTLDTWGIGSSYHMWIACPVLLLFSYTKQPRFKVFNAVIPLYYAVHYFFLLAYVLMLMLEAAKMLV